MNAKQLGEKLHTLAEEVLKLEQPKAQPAEWELTPYSSLGRASMAIRHNHKNGGWYHFLYVQPRGCIDIEARAKALVAHLNATGFKGA